MKKLEDISKENIFKVPDDGYFEKLPGVIQARVAKPEPKVWFSTAFKFALPVVAIAIVVAVWFTSGGGSLENQLNEIQTEQLIVYLEESDLSPDLINDEIDLNEEDLNELEKTVISSMEPFDISLEDLSVEPDNF